MRIISVHISAIYLLVYHNYKNKISISKRIFQQSGSSFYEVDYPEAKRHDSQLCNSTNEREK